MGWLQTIKELQERGEIGSYRFIGHSPRKATCRLVIPDTPLLIIVTAEDVTAAAEQALSKATEAAAEYKRLKRLEYEAERIRSWFDDRRYIAYGEVAAVKWSKLSQWSTDVLDRELTDEERSSLEECFVRSKTQA